MNTPASIWDWLEHFASCVRNRDLEAGKTLFASEVLAYGTRTEQAHNLDELLEHQWAHIWPNTRAFRFLPDSVHTLASSDGSHVCVLALWDSLGLTATGETFPRRGRCTILLQATRNAPHGYLAIHTHFSKTPSGEV